MDAHEWQEAWDDASQATYYFHRVTGETSWTRPAAADGDSPWRQAIDEASQTPYYYHIHTGETSWTLPAERERHGEQDEPILVFAAVALQARFRGRRARETARRLLRARYEVSSDQETGGRVFTDVSTRVASAARPLLFARLGIPEGLEAASDGSDSEDFDALQDADDDDERAAARASERGEEEQEEDAAALSSAGKPRLLPRSKAQELVDEAEDAGEAATRLDLSGLNALRLSSRIWNLEHLRVLHLARNKLTRLPSGIQDLTRLEELDVSHNLLTRLPSCLQTTETLRVLRARGNRIASFSPRLWKLRELRELDLSHNALTELPFVEGDLALLRETREWQVGVGLLRALEVLRLSHNQLAAAPVSIGHCQDLVELDLSHNALAGALSDELASLSELKRLRLAHNALSALPEDIGELAQLEALDVSHNALRALPDGVGALRRLEALDASDNDLRALPEAFGALERLETLVLDRNPRLTALGAFFRRLTRLARVSVGDCAVARIESPDAFQAAPIRELLLANNALQAFTLRLGEHSLETLDLSGSGLESAPAEVLACCQRLRTLRLSDNRLSTLPSSIGRLATLETLDLSGNALERLPDELTQCAALRELRADRNSLAALPARMGALRRLERLHVAFNRLAALPASLRDLGALQCVYANNNALAAPPASLLVRARDARRPCFVELSNNPFLRATPAPGVWKAAFAQAVARIDAQAFARAEQQLSALLRSSQASLTDTSVHWGEHRRWRPRWHLARALSRVLQLPAARRAVDGASERVAGLETARTGAELLAGRQRLAGVKLAMTAMRSGSQDEHADKLKEAVLALAERPEGDESARPRLDEAREEQAAAVTQLKALARGALGDLRAFVRAGETSELPTALYLEGMAFSALGQHADAARSFSAALAAIHAPRAADTVARESVHVLACRAEALGRLGQLPRALRELRPALSQLPAAELGEQRREALEELARALESRWEAQRAELFVDDCEASRAFDVDASTGLLRRPEVTDVADDADAEDASLKTRTGVVALAPLPPAQRFARDVAAKAEALAVAREKTRAAFEAVGATNAAQLARARDAKREVREALRLEKEEAAQRAVEAELARLAAELAAERERESHEQLWMQFEDEYAAWLAAEQARVETERLRRIEAAQRKAEAKAAYEKRLARRGGRRQAKARRT